MKYDVFVNETKYSQQHYSLTLSKTIHCFHVSAVQVFQKILWEKETLLVASNFFFFTTVFSALLKNVLPFLSNLKLLSANSFSLEEFKICRLGKHYFKHIYSTSIEKQVLSSFWETTAVAHCSKRQPQEWEFVGWIPSRNRSSL